MGRVFDSSFGVNSTTGGIEWTGKQGSPTIVTSPFPVGSLALRAQGGATNSLEQRLLTADGNGPFYIRDYIYVQAAPSTRKAILYIGTSGGAQRGAIALETDMTLKAFTTTNQIGSASAAIALNSVHYIELYLFNNTVSGKMELTAKLDGTTFATTTADTQTGTFGFTRVGWQGAGGDTADIIHGHVAINDSSGSVQNSFPGRSYVLTLSPNADGDAHAWLNTAGSAGTSNNYQLVDELPPNDATDLVKSVTNTNSDMYNVTNAGLLSTDIVNVVSVWGRFNNETSADATTAFKFQVEKTAAGTKTQSAAIIPNTTTWNTNSTATTHLPPVVTYTDPDGAAWTNTTIDSMQIGQIITAAGTQRIQVSAIWANVDYTPTPTVIRYKTSRLPFLS